ncbi:MAG TPA: BatD family protein [Dinghuibacter sp.]|uniref:BatD family protein n=1 Tax=Dinghuibacter sp. TaxID=2024697 RepID=UPI002C7E0F12|nr:BatD family protein [Dinghuibacter sp.]HTJ13431.1 BatD family protein [Dinghuibacter sp.]
MTPIRFSLFCFLMLAAAQRLSAQASFTAKVSPKVAGDQDVVEIDFTLDGVSEVDQFAPPNFSPFQVVQGPSYTSGFQLINGNASRYYSVSFYLKPSGLGKFTIGPATAQLNGQAVHSNSVTIEIVKGSVGGNTAPQSPFQSMMPPMSADPFPGREAYGDQFLRKGEKAEDKIRHNMILKMNASRNTVYVGEPVVATCKLYSRLESDSKVAERPSFSGFSVFEMVQPEQGSVSREVLGGRPFNTYLIRKAQLYPLQSGDLTIEPVEIDNNITFFREGKPAAKAQQAPAGSVFDQMMRDFWGDEEGVSGVPEKHTLNLTTAPITIHVKPLPDAGKPLDFTGAVGQFTLQANLTSTTVKANQTDTLQLVLTGSGNLPLINAPSMRLPDGLEAFDPAAKEQIDQTISPIKGRKIFSYAFTAGRDGKYTLPGVRFSYFDPQTATYKTDSTAPLLLDVLPGPGGHRAPDSAVVQNQRERHTPGWIWAAAAAVVALIVLLGLSRRKKSQPVVQQPTPKTTGPIAAAAGADNAPMRRTAEMASQPQPYIAPAAITTFQTRDWMEAARHQLRDGNSGAYYRELNAGLWGMLRERLELGQERDKALVLQRLQQKGFSPFVTEEVRRLLEECELSLYAPIHTGADMQRSLDVAERLQKRFEHGLKD